MGWGVEGGVAGPEGGVAVAAAAAAAAVATVTPPTPAPVAPGGTSPGDRQSVSQSDSLAVEPVVAVVTVDRQAGVVLLRVLMQVSKYVIVCMGCVGKGSDKVQPCYFVLLVWHVSTWRHARSAAKSNMA